MPPANPQRAIWRFAENENDNVDLKCNTSMIEKFSSLKNQYLQSLADNLESRLSARTGDGDVLEALSQLTSPKSLLDFSLEPDHSSEIKGLVDTVCDWYAEKTKAAKHSESNNTPGCCVPAAISRLRLEEDLPKVINLTRECYAKLGPTAFIQRILTEHGDALPAYSSMCKLLLCVPVTSVECERAFSLQNRIKTKLRNRLGEERVDLLMRISMGPSIDTFEHNAAVRHWQKQKQRRLAMLYRPAKRSNNATH